MDISMFSYIYIYIVQAVHNTYIQRNDEMEVKQYVLGLAISPET